MSKDRILVSDPSLSLFLRSIIGALIGISAALCMTAEFGSSAPDNGLKNAAFFIGSGVGGFFSGFLLARGMGRSGVKGWILSFLTYVGCMVVASLFTLVAAAFIGIDGVGLIYSVFYSIMFVFSAFVGEGSAIWPISFIILQLIAVRLRSKWDTNTSSNDTLE